MSPQSTQPNGCYCASPWFEGILYYDGSLRPCCLNSTVLGDWQTDTIAATWNSKRYQEFRNKIIAGEFPDDNCRRCYANKTPRMLNHGLAEAFDIYHQQLSSFFNKNIPEISTFKLFLSKWPQDVSPTERTTAIKDYTQALYELDSNQAVLPKPISLAISKLHTIGLITRSFLEGNLTPPIIAPYREVQIIAKCNARCIQCMGTFTGRTTTGRTIDDKHLPEAFSHPEHIINFFNNGSELLLYKNWKHITSILVKAGTRITLSTNTILFSKTTIQYLIDNDLLLRLNISLDGATKETVEKVRVNVKFDQMVENLTFFFQYAEQKKCRFPITFSFVLMQINHRELPAFVRLIERLRGASRTVACNILIQSLVSLDVQGYRKFLREQHPSFLDKSTLVLLFQETLKESKRSGIPVTYTSPLEDFIEQGCPFPSLHDPQQLLEFGGLTEHGITLRLTEGWHGVELEPIPARWVTDKATIVIGSNAESQKDIILTMTAFHKPKRCVLTINHQEIYNRMLTQEITVVTIPIALQPGENKLEILSMDGAESPADIPELNSPDDRKLAFHVRGIEFI